MGLVNVPNTFTAGATIVAAEENSNFSTIYDEFNGNITNANVKSTAAIDESKSAFDDSGGHDHAGSGGAGTKVDLSAPNAIGGTTPAAITGTTLKADTSLELATGSTVTGILDEDAMGSDSDTQLATQQSIKAYADALPTSSFFIGTTTRDLTTASGNQTVSGVGFQPTHVLFMASLAAATSTAANGMDDGSTATCTYRTGGATTWNRDVDDSMRLETTNSSTRQTANIGSFNSDGFVLAWVKSGTPTGTAYVIFMAFK